MEDTSELKKTWKEFVPRKIAGGLIAMLLIAQAASELKDAAKWQFGLTIGCMSLLGVIAIWTHYLLERGSKSPQNPQIDADIIHWGGLYRDLQATVLNSCNPSDDCNDPIVLKRYMKTCLDEANKYV